ncbi:MAG TPA: protein kinase [Thermoanaerobaculia bacterium]|nr:protein kinase [Thermoanaerobaculia bacterium]
MALAPGSRFGIYEIVAPIGSGGMGEVYRARDDRLHREVAIKVLPQHSCSDREAVARFQLEAQAASALNHPHILTIYEIGIAEAQPYIAMELVAGETLRDRISRENDIPSLLDLLIQIADALARAHEANIIHRDLKPENIMVTPDGYAKILDFGLAKLLARESDSNAPTIVAPGSIAGGLMGTIGYIAPEQVNGGPADARSDIFSFGCIVYEAIARRRAFRGDTPTETLQQIAALEPPPLRNFNPVTPPELQRIVTRCLAKKPEDRYQTMKDVGADLRRLRDRLRSSAGRTIPRLVQLTFDKAIEHFPAISSDGSRLVFSREIGKVRKLFLKDVEQGAEEAITDGPHDDIQASWTPAGDAILFVRAADADTRLEPGDVFGVYITPSDIWRIDLATRKATTILRTAYNPTSSPDGKLIAFDASWSGPRRIWVADARGRNPQQLTTDTTEAAHHARPRWSPDGKRIVFQCLEGTKFNVRVVDGETKRMLWVTNDYTIDLHPVWSADGESIVLSSYRSGGLNLWRIPVDVDGTPIGPMEQITAGAGQDVEADVALRSGRVVFSILTQNADIWRLPVNPATGDPTGPPEAVIASTRENSRGAWSPDGAQIAFNSDRSGAMNLWLSAAGKLRQLTRGAGGDFQPSWSPDGQSLAFFSGRGGATDIWTLDLKTEALARLTSGEGLSINPFFSPDGRQIAFQSDRDGRLELWIMNADGSNVRQLTTTGIVGHFVRWSQDGQHIYYRCPTGPRARTMLVPVKGGDPQETAEVIGGSHMSLSPDQSMIMDVVGHRTLWLSPLRGGTPRKIFEFDDADSRIDYPVWSPDGRWILFDRFVPHGGDVWMVEV